MKIVILLSVTQTYGDRPKIRHDYEDAISLTEFAEKTGLTEDRAEELLTKGSISEGILSVNLSYALDQCFDNVRHAVLKEIN